MYNNSLPKLYPISGVHNTFKLKEILNTSHNTFAMLET